LLNHNASPDAGATDNQVNTISSNCSWPAVMGAMTRRRARIAI
jgi:hypothetical protein